MKKTIFTLAITIFIAGTMFTSCQSSAKKVEDAQNNVIEANKDLTQAKEEYLMDMENYRSKTLEIIANNNKSIAEFNARINNQKKEAKADYKKKVAALEQKNSDMKKRLDEYSAEGKEKWEAFKTEFSNEMEALGKSLKDLTDLNPK